MDTPNSKEYPLNIADPANSLGYTSRASSRIFERVIQWAIASRNIQLGHWYFLRVLWVKDGVTQKQLADAVHVTESTAVSALAGMEKRGLIRRERSLSDKRKIEVWLTDEGRALKKEFLPVAEKINMVASQGLNEDELSTYFRVSKKITNNMTVYFKDEVFGK